MKWKWLVLGIPLLPIAVLAFLNVRDYRRYKFITELERHVTPEQFAAMARACEGTERHYSNEIRKVEMAPEFAVLDPVSVAASEECFYVKLYERGYVYAALSLSSTPRNQRVHLNHNFDLKHNGRDVWLRNPNVEGQMRLKGRLLTVAVWPGQEYVITPDSCIVISRSISAWRDDEILKTQSLMDDDVRRVKEAVSRIPRETRGKVYRTGVDDGISLRLTFSADGSRSSEDILLDNAWCDALEEIVAVVTEIVPSEYPLPTREDLEQYQRRGASVRVFTNAEWANTDFVPTAEYPWWLVWPRIVLGVRE